MMVCALLKSIPTANVPPNANAIGKTVRSFYRSLRQIPPFKTLCNDGLAKITQLVSSEPEIQENSSAFKRYENLIINLCTGVNKDEKVSTSLFPMVVSTKVQVGGSRLMV